MKINIYKSKLLPCVKTMPSLKHSVTRVGGKWVRDSEVLRWLASSEDVQMWAMSILRISGIIIPDGVGYYKGNEDWDGADRIFKNKRRVSSKNSSPRLGRVENFGRPKIYGELDVLKHVSQIQPITSFQLMQKSIIGSGMSRQTFFRIMKKLRVEGVLFHARSGWLARIIQPASDTTSGLPDCSKDSPPPEAAS